MADLLTICSLYHNEIIVLQCDVIKMLLVPEHSKRPSAEEVASSDALKRLRKAVKKCKGAYVPPL